MKRVELSGRDLKGLVGMNRPDQTGRDMRKFVELARRDTNP